MLLPRRLALHELLGPLRGAVVHRHRVARVVDVQHQILAHHGQADQAEVLSHARCSPNV